MKGLDTIFIGVAWPYANGPLHIGQVAGCYYPPDIFARYHRMKGNRVLMVSGSDMHGTPVTVKAEEEGVTPKEIAERYHAMNTQSLKDLGVRFDVFESTEHEVHIEVVKNLFLRLHENGYIYEKEMTLPYCSQCDKYLPDRYVEGVCPHCEYENARGDQCEECGKLLEPEQLIKPRCKRCGEEPKPVTRTHLFFKLSAFEETLKEYVKDKDYWRAHVVNFTRNWLEQGLKDRPISRDIDWGIDIPLEGYDDKKIYVWFEAFMGYLTMVHVWARQQGDPEKWREFWQNPEARHYYFLGKDNVPFHTIFWPAVILGVDDDLNLPYNVPANAFMRFGGEQFSKSRGVSLALKDLLEEYDADALRYYLAVIMPENRDADFSLREFVEKNNNELVATYGNFVHRALSFTQKNFGQIPEEGEVGDLEKKAFEEIKKCVSEVGQYLEKCEFKRGIKRAMELARFGNQYIDTKAPWSQIKEDKGACGTTLHTSLHIARALSIIMTPYMPHASQKLWEMLGEEGEVSEAGWDDAVGPPKAGFELEPPQPLFKKLEDIEMETDKPDFPEEMKLLDLRIGKITAVFDHPNADKLIIMKVDLGDEERDLVAGLKEHYSKEELVDKFIVVVCNLKPARLRGIESKGMLLAASGTATAGGAAAGGTTTDGGAAAGGDATDSGAAAEDEPVVSILQPDGEVVPGERILGTEGKGQLSFPDFQKLGLEIGAEGPAEFISSDGQRAVLKTEKAVMVPDKVVKTGAKIR